jgi:thiosulfate dehydrogenase
MRMKRAAGPVLAVALALCWGCDDEQVPAAQLGARLFNDRALSTSPVNVFSCGTCHVVRAPGADPGAAARIDAGYNLHDTVRRPTWWGGDRIQLRDAINFCMTQFMGGRALEADEPRARQLHEYLADNAGDGPQPPLPLTVVRTITPLAELAGDATRGQALWDRACRHCHGDPHTGRGAISSRASVVPEATQIAFPSYGPALIREVIIEKVRHGKFFDIGGVMPFYTTETLSNQDVVDVVTYLGL